MDTRLIGRGFPAAVLILHGQAVGPELAAGAGVVPAGLLDFFDGLFLYGAVPGGVGGGALDGAFALDGLAGDPAQVQTYQ